VLRTNETFNRVVSIMKKTTFIAVALLVASTASATPETSTSPTGLDVSTLGASTVGGIVADLLGINGAHIVSQLAATTLYVGFYDDGTPVAYRGNPGTIGVQQGYDDSLLDLLGGGSVPPLFASPFTTATRLAVTLTIMKIAC
jgi:hypothetical protein